MFDSAASWTDCQHRHHHCQQHHCQHHHQHCQHEHHLCREQMILLWCRPFFIYSNETGDVNIFWLNFRQDKCIFDFATTESNRRRKKLIKRVNLFDLAFYEWHMSTFWTLVHMVNEFPSSFLWYRKRWFCRWFDVKWVVGQIAEVGFVWPRNF